MRASVVVVALFLPSALAAPQSLGDAAQRQARQRSKQAPPPKVYTEADLREKDDAPASAPADAAAPSARADADAGTVIAPAKGASEDAVRAQLDREAEAREKRELQWRGLARVAAARLAEAQRGYEASCGPGAVVVAGG